MTLAAGGQRYDVIGEVCWSPGPSPWLAGAALLAAAVALAGRRYLAVPLGIAVAASMGHPVGALAARTAEGSRWALLGDYLPQAGWGRWSPSSSRSVPRCWWACRASGWRLTGK